MRPPSLLSADAGCYIGMGAREWRKGKQRARDHETVQARKRRVEEARATDHGAYAPRRGRHRTSAAHAHASRASAADVSMSVRTHC